MSVNGTVQGWPNGSIKAVLLEQCITTRSRSGLTGVYTAYTHEVYEWAFENNVEIDLIRTWTEDGFDYSRWHLPNSEDRIIFALKWGSF